MTSSTSPQPTAHGPWRRPGGDQHVLDLGRLLLGATVLTLGVLYLLDAAGSIDAGDVVHDWWPAFLVAAGLVTLLERPPSVLRGTILTGAGVLLLLFTTDTLHGNAWSYLWPAALVVGGLLIVGRWRGRAVVAGARDEDVVRATGVFGGPDIASTSQSFRGAWLTAIFGGVSLDLRQARPAPDGASINATAAFGGIDVLVPRGWRISVRSTPIFGGVEDKTDREAVDDGAPTLHVDALAVFGGVALKHEK